MYFLEVAYKECRVSIMSIRWSWSVECILHLSILIPEMSNTCVSMIIICI